MPPVRVKICGLTCAEDVRAAVDAGADALGFVLEAASPRCVTAAVAGRLAAAAPPYLARVAVMRRADASLRLSPQITAVQVYEGVPHAGRPVVRAFRIAGRESLVQIEDLLAAGNPVSAVLLDACHPEKLGGSGLVFDWEIAREARRRFPAPIILAGGLTPENVAAAVRAVRPYAVDVSSGVEASPGRKDPARMREFIRAAKAA